MSVIFGGTRQLGFVVPDFDAALHYWTSVQGVGPFFCIRNTRVDGYLYHGREAASPLISLAFGYSGDLQIEVISQHDATPSCYVDFLNSGRRGAHHVCGFCDTSVEYDARYAKALKAGIDAIHEGSMGGVRFAYFDTETEPGAVISEISEAGMSGPRALFERMRVASERWDGAHPIRSIEQA